MLKSLFAFAILGLLAIPQSGQAQNPLGLALGIEPCISLDSLGSDDAPPRIGNAILTCLKENNLSDGIELYAALLVIEAYDEERLTLHNGDYNQTGWVRDEVDDFINQMEDLNRINDYAKSRMETPGWCQELRGRVTALGPRVYWPSYLYNAGPAPNIIPRHPLLLWIKTVKDEMDCDS